MRDKVHQLFLGMYPLNEGRWRARAMQIRMEQQAALLNAQGKPAPKPAEIKVNPLVAAFFANQAANQAANTLK
jgi:hypothetical protein